MQSQAEGREDSFITVEMKLILLLVGLPIVLGNVDNEYQGFYGCGQRGWTCRSANDQNEITFTCPPPEQTSRIWIWSARFPLKTAIFTVRDCVHLEVHVDCTSGMRSSIIKQFNVINVKNLEILRPTKKGLHLHDNEEYPQWPSSVRFENVESGSFYPGLFDEPNPKNCNKLTALSNFTLVNVHLDKFPANLFRDKNLNRLTFKNVTIDSVESNSLSVTLNEGAITGSRLPDLPFNAIQLRTRGRLKFVNNTVRKIQSHGLIIRSSEFLFSGNAVEEIGSEGMDVLGSKIEISKNRLHHLDSRALEKIAFSYVSQNFELASKFVYNFSNNDLEDLNPGSLHPNWLVIKELCADIVVKNNHFNCSCINFGWMTMSQGLGPKISKFNEFYDLYVKTNDNACKGNENCSLKTVVNYMQDICSNKFNVMSVCNESGSIRESNTNSAVRNSSPSTLSKETEKTTAMSNKVEPTTESIQHNDYLDVEEMKKNIPLQSYSETLSAHHKSHNHYIWFAAVPFIIAFIGLFVWWYKKRNQQQTVTTMYKSQKNNDSDSLIVINEHSNELFNDRN